MLAAGAAAAAGLLALPAGAQASLPAARTLLTRAPYLTDLTETSVQVSWATATHTTGTVEYGTSGACTAHSVTPARPGGPITVNGTTEYQYSVAVTGLSAATVYCYRIVTGASRADLLGTEASPHFTTLQPASGRKPLTFDVLDDWGDTTSSGVNTGSVNANQAAVNAAVNTSGAQFLISIGDTGYQDGSQTNYGDLRQTGPYISGVFGPSYWAAPGQHIPVFQGNGDHGENKTVLDVWPEPATALASGGKDSMVSDPSVDGTTAGSYPASYFAFSTGGVRFYLLDAAWGYTNVGTAGGASCAPDCAMYQVDHDQHWKASSAEYRWLARDLAAHPGGVKLAFFHFPLYSDDATEPGDSYLDTAAAGTGRLEQLLHGNGVNLAFNGHAHDYQRNIAVPGGVTSYVTGGGGASASAVGHRGCSTTDAYAVGWSYGSSGQGTACGAAAKPTTDAQVYHFLKVTVHGMNVTVTPTNAQGHTFDVHTYDFAPDTTPPSAPGRLTASAPTRAHTVLTWMAATDNIGVSAYDIDRNGTYLATVGPGATSYTDVSASLGAGFTYRVAARDLAGNTTSATVLVNGGSSGSRTWAAARPSPVGAHALGQVAAGGAQLLQLRGGQLVDDVRADGGDVPGRAGRELGQAGWGQLRVHPAPVFQALHPADPASPLQTGHGPGHPAAGGQRSVGQFPHAEPPVWRLGELHQELVIGE